jgi:hypothetical protein
MHRLLQRQDAVEAQAARAGLSVRNRALRDFLPKRWISVAARMVFGNTMACRHLDSDHHYSRPRLMFLTWHGLCLIRLFPVMLVCVVGMNGCSSGQRFLSQPPAPASAELPYYASRPDLKVYSAPRRGSRVLATLTRHQKVLRSDVQRGYARIRTADGRIQGWVDNGLLIWRLPAAKPSGTRSAAVKYAPQPAPVASSAQPAALAEPASPLEQVVTAEPAAPAETAAPVAQSIPTEPVVLAEEAAPAEASPPAEITDGVKARPGAEVFDRY